MPPAERVGRHDRHSRGGLVLAVAVGHLEAAVAEVADLEIGGRALLGDDVGHVPGTWAWMKRSPSFRP